MSERASITIDPAFSLEIPPHWTAEPDEEEGVRIYATTGAGLLHLAAFEQPPGEMPDPGEELYEFLEDQGIELEEDEIEDLLLGESGEMALCEYISAEEGDEEGEAETYWMVGVAVAPGNLVFCNYSCPAAEAEAEREAVREILTSLRLHEPD
ncbi:MAG TPA: hypothetical protein VFL93_16230 [Longimicrobiaceae bacterium]|nr:hypothetical protein [Longimicrobiaceae bacterium]